MPKLAVHILSFNSYQTTFHKSTCISYIFHKSYESNTYQHIIIKSIANKSHTGQTHSLNISYSQYTQ